MTFIFVEQISLNGVVVKLVITSACHAEGRGFESRQLRQFFSLYLAKTLTEVIDDIF